MKDIRPLVRKEKPDFSRFLKVLKREGGRDYVPFLEMVFEVEYLESLTGMTPPCKLNMMPTSPSFEASFGYYLRACAAMGFDHGTINLCGFRGFPAKRHGGAFMQMGDGTVTSWEDFESYEWPSIDMIDLAAMERTAKLAPEGMGVLTGGNAPFQTAMDLMGLENLSVLLYEDPDLVKAVVDKVGSTMAAVSDLVCAQPYIDGFFHTGDMGHKTGTFISPDQLREYFLPWHKRVVDAAHKHGKVCLLHSCGNLHAIMPDIIDCGYDGKHSFEDVIRPGILDLHQELGDQIALIGGIDVDFLTRSSEDAIRQRVRDYIDAMAPGGGHILGSGNSIPDWCPKEKWWALLDEGLKYGR